MSIHDVDTRHSDRGNPMPNTSDEVFQRQAHGVNSVNYNSPGPPMPNNPLKSGFYRVVQSDTVLVSGSANDVNITAVPHNLGYTPFAQASLNNASLFSGGSNEIGPGSLFLPTWLGLDLTSGTNIVFDSYLSFFVDNDNIYFMLIGFNLTGTEYYVTYYLSQQAVE